MNRREFISQTSLATGLIAADMLTLLQPETKVSFGDPTSGLRSTTVSFSATRDFLPDTVIAQAEFIPIYTPSDPNGPEDFGFSSDVAIIQAQLALSYSAIKGGVATYPDPPGYTVFFGIKPDLDYNTAVNIGVESLSSMIIHGTIGPPSDVLIGADQFCVGKVNSVNTDFWPSFFRVNHNQRLGFFASGKFVLPNQGVLTGVVKLFWLPIYHDR